MSAPTCRACCPSCGLHFAGDRAFDRHLGGERNGWAHHDPLDVTDRAGAAVFGREAGLCRNGAESEAEVTVWHVAAERAAARARFGAERARQRAGGGDSGDSPARGSDDAPETESADPRALAAS